MPIIINDLGHGHTHKYTQTHISTIHTGSNLRNQVHAGHIGWCTPGLKKVNYRRVLPAKLKLAGMDYTFIKV